MTLEQLRRPALPLNEQHGEGLLRSLVGVAAQQLGRGGWRAGAGVQQGDADFPARKRAVEHWEIAHDHGQKSESRARFQNRQNARGGTLWSNIAKAQRKNVRSADVKVRVEACMHRSFSEGAAYGEIDEPEADDHSAGPHHKQKHERERAVVAERCFALARGSDTAGKEGPRSPRG